MAGFDASPAPFQLGSYRPPDMMAVVTLTTALTAPVETCFQVTPEEADCTVYLQLQNQPRDSIKAMKLSAAWFGTSIKQVW